MLTSRRNFYHTTYQDRMERMGIGSIEPEEGMEVLEQLLNGPMEQLALIKTLKADGMKRMGAINPNEWINNYAQSVPWKSLQSLEDTLSNQFNQEEQWDQATSVEGLQSPEMEELFYKLLLGNVQSFLKSSTNVLNRYARWMEESCSVLVAKNYLKKQDEESYTLVGPAVDLEELWKQWDTQKTDWIKDANKKVQVILVETCLRALPEILTGKQQATDVMFPNSSMELVEGIYKGNVVSDWFNDILGKTLVSYIQERLDEDASSQMRILEIEAGTGGTTAGLLSKLNPFEKNIEEYCYTDLSKAFLMHAQEHYVPDAAYLTTQIFDVEKPIAAQKIEADKYDVVIAANVLHATKNIRQTLRNAKAAMRKGGILLLNEISCKSLFAHLTFGLLEGWWLYEDASLRVPGSPGLTPETWKRVLKEEGFVSTFFPAKKAHALGQQIIVAQSDGVVRQKQRVNLNLVSTQKRTKIEVLKESSINKESIKSVSREETSLESLREKSVQYVKRLVAETLKMKSHEIDASQPLEVYGIDSILVVQLTNTMRKVFDNISSTLFFEVQSIDGLVEYLIKTQKEALIREVGFEEKMSILREMGAIQESVLISSGLIPRGLPRFRNI